MSKHGRDRPAQKPFGCAFCNRRFNSEEGAAHHARDVHPDGDTRKLPPIAARTVPVWIAPICVECGETAALTDGQSIYPHRPDLWAKSIYLCGCGAYVGCHPGTHKPLGYPCGPVTRKWRSAAHEAFDPLWKSKRVTRHAAYAWLAAELGVEGKDCHIGMMTEDQARRVVQVARARAQEIAA